VKLQVISPENARAFGGKIKKIFGEEGFL